MAKEKMDRSRQKDTFIKVLNYMKPYWFYLALSLVLAAVTGYTILSSRRRA